MTVRYVAILLALLLVAFPAHASPKATPMSEVALATALIAGHRDALGKRVGGHRLSVAWAQVALETGRGKRVKGYDLGNVGGRLISYKTARQGAQAYWQAIAKCGPALAFFDAGDARGAAMQLGLCGYFTAAPEPYASGMVSLRESFNRRIWARVKAKLGH